MNRTNYPQLVDTDFELTSPVDVDYNCFAWAAGVQDVCWGPLEHPPYYWWPEDAPVRSDLDAYSAAFGTLGYEVAENGDLEAGIEKIALYAKSFGETLHAARQLANGYWTSKLGGREDIVHVSTECLEGPKYGVVMRYLRRTRLCD